MSTSADPVTASAPPSPITGFSLTREHQSAGGRAAAEKRRAAAEEARMTHEQRLARALDAKFDAIVSAALAQAEQGDIRAFTALWDRVHGTPKQRVETEDVSDRDTPVDLERIRELQAKAKGLKAA